MRDDDDDGYGDALASLPVAAGSDCDDDDADIHPTAPETCGDAVDSDCDGEDPACPLLTIQVSLTDATTLTWSVPTESIGLSTVYRGDMEVLRNTGIYTQEPGSVPGAARFCDVSGGSLLDPFLPAPGKVLFYLVTTQTGSGESSLGPDSSGLVRANTHPCP
jgi:hypothetical protein